MSKFTSKELELLQVSIQSNIAQLQLLGDAVKPEVLEEFKDLLVNLEFQEPHRRIVYYDLDSDVARDKNLNATYLVEATHNEQSHLWQMYKDKWDESKRHSDLFVTIGSFSGQPVTLSLSFVTINRTLVCFWESPSLVVNHDMIRTWFKKYMPLVENRSDATNFHLPS